jgi:hypothetical protein
LLTLGDIAAVDVYVKGTWGFYPQTVTDILQDVRGVIDSKAPGKPIWYISQAFSDREIGFIKPTPDEYRDTIDRALAQGVTGLFPFVYDGEIFSTVGIGVKPGEPLWDEIARINHNLKPTIKTPACNLQCATPI